MIIKTAKPFDGPSDILNFVDIWRNNAGRRTAANTLLRDATFIDMRRGRVSGYPGGFAYIFKIQNQANRKTYALRFWHNGKGRLPSYDNAFVTHCQSVIKHLTTARSHDQRMARLFCETHFIPNAIEGHPCLLMEWGVGKGLADYLTELQAGGQTREIQKVSRNFLEMVKMLHQNEISHGDFSHDNILVDDSGNLRLIDYDDLYFKGDKSKKTDNYEYISHGTDGYQSKHRENWHRGGLKLNPWIDYFSELVIYTSLLAFEKAPQRFKVNGAASIFLPGDFVNPLTESEQFRKLIQWGGILKKLALCLAIYCEETDGKKLRALEVIVDIASNAGDNATIEEMRTLVALKPAKPIPSSIPPPTNNRVAVGTYTHLSNQYAWGAGGAKQVSPTQSPQPSQKPPPPPTIPVISNPSQQTGGTNTPKSNVFVQRYGKVSVHGSGTVWIPNVTPPTPQWSSRSQTTGTRTPPPPSKPEGFWRKQWDRIKRTWRDLNKKTRIALGIVLLGSLGLAAIFGISRCSTGTAGGNKVEPAWIKHIVRSWPYTHYSKGAQHGLVFASFDKDGTFSMIFQSGYFVSESEGWKGKWRIVGNVLSLDYTARSPRTQQENHRNFQITSSSDNELRMQDLESGEMWTFSSTAGATTGTETGGAIGEKPLPRQGVLDYISNQSLPPFSGVPQKSVLDGIIAGIQGKVREAGYAGSDTDSREVQGVADSKASELTDTFVSKLTACLESLQTREIKSDSEYNMAMNTLAVIAANKPGRADSAERSLDAMLYRKQSEIETTYSNQQKQAAGKNQPPPPPQPPPLESTPKRKALEYISNQSLFSPGSGDITDKNALAWMIDRINEEVEKAGFAHGNDADAIEVRNAQYKKINELTGAFVSNLNASLNSIQTQAFTDTHAFMEANESLNSIAANIPNVDDSLKRALETKIANKRQETQNALGNLDIQTRDWINMQAGAVTPNNYKDLDKLVLNIDEKLQKAGLIDRAMGASAAKAFRDQILIYKLAQLTAILEIRYREMQPFRPSPGNSAEQIRENLVALFRDIPDLANYRTLNPDMDISGGDSYQISARLEKLRLDIQQRLAELGATNNSAAWQGQPVTIMPIPRMDYEQDEQDVAVPMPIPTPTPTPQVTYRSAPLEPTPQVVPPNYRAPGLAPAPQVVASQNGLHDTWVETTGRRLAMSEQDVQGVVESITQFDVSISQAGDQGVQRLKVLGSFPKPLADPKGMKSFSKAYDAKLGKLRDNVAAFYHSKIADALKKRLGSAGLAVSWKAVDELRADLQQLRDCGDIKEARLGGNIDSTLAVVIDYLDQLGQSCFWVDVHAVVIRRILLFNEPVPGIPLPKSSLLEASVGCKLEAGASAYYSQYSHKLTLADKPAFDPANPSIVLLEFSHSRTIQLPMARNCIFIASMTQDIRGWDGKTIIFDNFSRPQEIPATDDTPAALVASTKRATKASASAIFAPALVWRHDGYQALYNHDDAGRNISIPGAKGKQFQYQQDVCSIGIVFSEWKDAGNFFKIGTTYGDLEKLAFKNEKLGNLKTASDKVIKTMASQSQAPRR